MASNCQRAILSAEVSCNEVFYDQAPQRQGDSSRGHSVSDISIISVLVFLALTLAIEAGYWMTWRAYRVQLAMRRRLASNQWSTNNDRAASLRRETLGLEVFQNPLLQPLNAYLVQSGLRIERKTLLILGLSFAAVLFGGLGPFAGFGFLTFTVALLLATAAIALF